MAKKEKKQENTELEQQLGEYKLHLQRLQADFENFIKRTDQEKQKYSDYLESQVLSKFLTFADDFEKTIESMKDSKEIKNIQEATNILFKNFTKILESNNVKPFKSLNQKCDPNKHEIIETIGGKEDNIVIEELRKGYMHKDKILRPAIVKSSFVPDACDGFKTICKKECDCKEDDECKENCKCTK